VGIAGEPGIGKTTLVDEFLARMNAGTPAWVARGRCSERLAGTEAYLPILESIESLLRGDVTGEIAQTLWRVAPSWASQVLPDPVQQKFRPPVPSQDRLKQELGNLFEELSRTQPVVLIVEDLHWAGASTVELLAYLGMRLGSLRALVLVTYRLEELQFTRHPFIPVKLELQARGTCREVKLDFLTQDDLERYLELVFPDHRFPPGFAQLLHTKTEGSPLFMVDLVRTLHDRGVIARHEGRWRLTQELREVAREVPESVRSMIDRKIGLLSDADRQLLRVASVQGDRFDAAIVADALGLDAADVEERLEALERQLAFVRGLGERELPDGTITLSCRFVHVLYQNALYRSLTPARRASLSSAVAEALEQHYTSRHSEVAAELAVLFETARAPDRAVHYFGMAAEHAGRMSAHREAVSLGEHGQRLLAAQRDDDHVRRRLELNLLAAVGPSLVASRGYGAPEVRDTYARARELSQQLDDRLRHFAALRGLWEYHLLRSNVRAALELAHELYDLAERLGDTALRVVAHGVMGDTSLQLGDFAAARSYTDGGIAIYDPRRHASLATDYVGYDPGMGCCSMSANALWYLGFPDQALQRSQEAVTVARQLVHPSTLAFALGHAGLHHYLRREPRATLDRADEAMALSAEYGLAFWSAFAAILKGWSLVQLEGNSASIEQMKQGLLGYRDTGGSLERPYWLAMLAESYQSTGRIGEALATVELALQECRDAGVGFFEAELHRMKGELILAQDTSDATIAEHSFLEALDIARRQLAKSLELRAAVSLSRLLESRGEEQRARRMLTGVFGWFSEGMSSCDLRAAEAFLAGRH
jgi:adenylate cyclase